MWGFHACLITEVQASLVEPAGAGPGQGELAHLTSSLQSLALCQLGSLSDEDQPSVFFHYQLPAYPLNAENKRFFC